MSSPMLDIRDLDAGYGKAQVLFGATLAVRQGEMLALLGTNGAGKSTLLKCVSGDLQPWRGDVLVDGTAVNGMASNDVARLGVSMMPGGKATFPSLEVSEHFRLAGWTVDPAEANDRMVHALDVFPRLRERWAEKAGSLSGGEQQQLGLAQAIIARPALLLIDELSLGLAPVVVERLLEVVRDLNDDGTTVVLVEQSLNVALELAERAVFMEKGQVRYDGPAVELEDRPDLLRAVFLGAQEGEDALSSQVTVATVSASFDDAPTVLAGHDLRVAFGGIVAVDGVSLEIRAAEIVALVGPNGAGKTTLFDLLSGQTQADSGQVTLLGQDVTGWRPDLLARAGLGRSFQDAKLFPSLTARETIAVALDRHLSRVGPAGALAFGQHVRKQERWAKARVDELLELLGLADAADKFVGDLSTGTRRVVDLACCLAHEPTVLLLDEPASGIAQKEVEALTPLLSRVVDWTGTALLIVEHDMPLVRSVADRVIVLAEGCLLAEGPPDQALSDPAVISAYIGEGVASRRSGTSTRVSA